MSNTTFHFVDILLSKHASLTLIIFCNDDCCLGELLNDLTFFFRFGVNTFHINRLIGLRAGGLSYYVPRLQRILVQSVGSDERFEVVEWDFYFSSSFWERGERVREGGISC